MAAIGQFPRLDIDESSFVAIRDSLSILRHALAIEEKYEIVVRNFIELEREVLSVAVEDSLRSGDVYLQSFETRSSLNVRVVNFLTSVRLYLDQLPGHLRRCISCDDSSETVKALKREQYDSVFEYRFMEALRNYVQHNGVPVHLVVFGASRPEFDQKYVEHSLRFCAKKEHLALDKKFKRSVLHEMPEKVWLGAASRTYFGCICRIHMAVRAMVKSASDQSRAILDKNISDYMVLFDSLPVALHAYEAEGGCVLDKFSVFVDWDEVRLALIKKNSDVSNVGRWYVTGKGGD